jgi:sodium pump decarboxylase gamma subunit
MDINLYESLILFAFGMSGVFATLMLLTLVIWSMKVIDERLNEKRIRSYSEKLETHAADGDDLNDEIVAVLAAAAESIMRRAITIKRIRFLAPASSEDSWSAAGRVNIMSSHSVPKR